MKLKLENQEDEVQLDPVRNLDTGTSYYFFQVE